jgi:hypothetical protein
MGSQRCLRNCFRRIGPCPTRRDPHVSYSPNPNVERFFVHVPEDYAGDTDNGLIVFTDAVSDSRQLPDGWQTVLDQLKVLYIAAQGAGDDQYSSRRLGLAVLTALEMMKHYRVDPSRVYTVGFSGGARMAGLGFHSGRSLYRGHGWKPYGLFDATANEIAGARGVRFALITASRDFRHGNILDTFNGGFAAEDSRPSSLTFPVMPHDTADAQTLSAALDFIEQAQ